MSSKVTSVALAGARRSGGRVDVAVHAHGDPLSPNPGLPTEHHSPKDVSIQSPMNLSPLACRLIFILSQLGNSSLGSSFIIHNYCENF